MPGLELFEASRKRILQNFIDFERKPFSPIHNYNSSTLLIKIHRKLKKRPPTWSGNPAPLIFSIFFDILIVCRAKFRIFAQKSAEFNRRGTAYRGKNREGEGE
jgi:hypothetical protein